MRGRHSAEEPEDRISYLDLDFVMSQVQPPQRPVEPAPPDLPGQPIEVGPLVAHAVSYTRAGRLILDGVTVTARPSEALAITGPSGSGKSSLLTLMAGLERPDSGTVGSNGVHGSSHHSPRLGLILQSYGLVGLLTAQENVEIPLQSGAFGRLPRADVSNRASAALAAVGLSPVAGHLTEELSGGQQQRVAIARALVVEPNIVIADELTAELDHAWKERVVELVLDIARRGGIVVVATHDLDIAARCDRVVRLVDGRLRDVDQRDFTVDV